jgi:hypothetical protein
VGGLALATTATQRREVAPVEMFTSTDTRTGLVSVVVRAPQPAGPFEIWAVSGTRERLLRSSFAVGAGQDSHTALTGWHPSRRLVAVLRRPGQDRALRAVVVAPPRWPLHQPAAPAPL